MEPTGSSLLICWLAFARSSGYSSSSNPLGSMVSSISTHTGWSLLVSFVLTVSIFSSNPFFYKTLSDETNLLSISRSLLIEKRAYNVTEGLYYYNNFQALKHGIPKRPLLHPYLVQWIHLSTATAGRTPLS